MYVEGGGPSLGAFAKALEGGGEFSFPCVEKRGYRSVRKRDENHLSSVRESRRVDLEGEEPLSRDPLSLKGGGQPIGKHLIKPQLLKKKKKRKKTNKKFVSH